MPSSRDTTGTGLSLAGFGLGGSRASAPNPAAAWRIVVLAAIVTLGALYAAPNLFPPDFALQVRSENSDAAMDAADAQRLREALEDAGVDVIGAEAGATGALLRVASSDDQLRGSAVLQELLNPAGQERQFVVALNLASTTPDWLGALGGKPMTLGLDLKGGAHFVLQVDMDQALAKRLGDEAEKVKDLLREQRIRYRSTADAVVGDTIRFGFVTADLRDRAIAAIEDEFRQPDYLLANGDVGGRPGFVITVQDAKIKEIEATAIEQNLTGLRNRINQLGVAEPLVQKLGGSRIVIDLPGVQDAAEAKRKTSGCTKGVW